MKNSNFTICNETIHPGEQVSLALPLPELFSCAPMYMPIKVVHGKQAGPCVLIIAAMHGNELNGTEIINRLLQSSNMKKIKGTLIAVPIMNVYGFINKARTLPGGASLANSFPGSAQGTRAARVAHLFCSEIFSLADYCIDLQTGWMNHCNLPQVFVTDDNQKELALAHAFGAPVISELSVQKNSLRAYANATKTPYLVYEAGEAMRFDEPSIRLGTKGIIRLMRHITMLPEVNRPHASQQKSILMHDTRWVRSPTSGISYSNIKLGQQVKTGEVLSVIKDPFGAGPDTPVKAPFDGVVVSMNSLPLVYEGVALFQLAAFERLSQAATHIEDWIDESESQVE
ncbi:MAG: succinylglutamate desuccinylase/aspartoacylase family protein [Coxiellaceae bacterium]|nr:succinylglutamate desuccinylase/aspartoacylase family protein [Coxiellaceae bacterium]